MLEFLKKALSDGVEASSTRLIIFYCMLLFFTTFVLAYGYIAFLKQSLQDIPTGVIGLITALGAWHVGGKFVETKDK